MKKTISFLLVLTLLAGLTAPALAADNTDERLAAVTAKVKQTLQLDTEAYDSFSGNVYETQLTPVWNLSWSGELGSLNIQAEESGTIISYSCYDKSDPGYSRNNFPPAFPEGSEASARAAAGAFLKKVLDASAESATPEPSGNLYLGLNQFSYYGTIELNKLPSPMNYSVSVRASDNAIVYFYRDTLNTKYLGGVPSASPSVGAQDAGTLLKSTLALKLEYVLSDDGKTAVLRYLPVYGDQYFVDAAAGGLVDLTKLYQDIAKSGDYGLGGSTADAAASPTEAPESGLTGAEQAGVDQLAGVLSKDKLDAALRAMAELGLQNYTLTSASYWVNQSDGSVTCRLQYSRQMDNGLWRRYITVDAKTGALQSIYSSIPWSDEKPAAPVTSAAAQKFAEGFLSKYYTEDYAKLALYDNGGQVSIYADYLSYSNSYGFSYAQKENGYFYPGNQYSVSIDASDGSVSSFSYNFDRSVTFDSPEGAITEAQALNAYFNTFQVQLGYLAVPEKLDPNSSEYIPLIKMGYTYLYSLRLSYSLVQSELGYVAAIDAKTGKPVVNIYTPAPQVSYKDLGGSWIKEKAEKLAQYNVGFLGGSFLPQQKLTQFDLLCLLVSTNGYLYDPATTDKSAADYVYDMAYSMGFLKPAQRSDDKIITRGEMVKILLDGAGYGEVAGLSGIFRCSYKDESSIPAEYYGYAALAQGLGLVGGDSAGNFAAGRAATRAEAAAMLYNMMAK